MAGSRFSKPMKHGPVCPVLTSTQARFLLGAARRAKEECVGGDERRTWEGAYRALSKAIEQMRSASAAAPAATPAAAASKERA